MSQSTGLESTMETSGLAPTAPPASLTLRRARMEDARLLWEWANDPGARTASFSGHGIAWYEHELWLAARLDSPTALLLIAERDSVPMGIARFALESFRGGDAVVSVNLAAEHRGHGLGAELIAAAARHCFATTTVRRILAWIKPENRTSREAFARAGYRSCGRSYWNGHPADLYVLDRSECAD